MDFKKFQIYNLLRAGIKKEEISKDFNVPMWFIESVEKYGYIEKLDTDFEKFYKFIDVHLDFNPSNISKSTGIPESKLRKME